MLLLIAPSVLLASVLQCGDLKDAFVLSTCCEADRETQATLATTKHDTCEATQFYTQFTHAFGGFAGCVSTYSSKPCEGYPNHDFVFSSQGSKRSLQMYDPHTKTCVDDTSVTAANRTISLWLAVPSATKADLIKAGYTPTTSIADPMESHLPFGFQYSRYTGAWNSGVYQSGILEELFLSYRAVYKYLDIFNDAQLASFPLDGYATGAENSMVQLVAIRAYDIAKRTCTRSFYVYQNAENGPHYGFDFRLGTAAYYTNEARRSSNYANHATCPAGTPVDVTIQFTQNASVVPGFPVSSTATESPWMEILVIPNNPDGRIDQPSVPTDRAICDGVYTFPSYFPNGTIPALPSCWAWGFSTHKLVVAGSRVGHYMFAGDDASFLEEGRLYVQDIAHDIGVGVPSQPSISQQLAVNAFLMKQDSWRHPDSWVQQQALTIKHKFDLIYDGFAACVEKNVLGFYGPQYSGIAAVLKVLPPYDAQNAGMQSGFLLKTINVVAKPILNDMIRVHIASVMEDYIELNRRAKVVCADISASLPGLQPVSSMLVAP